MNCIQVDLSKPIDAIVIGRATIDLNPLEYYCPLKESVTFKKYVGGSSGNIALGLTRLGKKVGFIGKLSPDSFGDYVYEYLEREGVDVTGLSRTTLEYRMGLTFTEITSPDISQIMMYRDKAADLQLSIKDIDPDYIKKAKFLVVSGTALAQSPSREAIFRAVLIAKDNNTKIVFDIDYRNYTWKNEAEISLYYQLIASQSDIILGSKEEFSLMEKLMGNFESDFKSAKYWLGKGSSLCIIKHGKNGSVAFSSAGDAYKVKPYPIHKLKGFGGGDGYAAGLIACLIDEKDLPCCLAFASAQASLLVASHACGEAMPLLKEVEQFMEKSNLKLEEIVLPF